MSGKGQNRHLTIKGLGLHSSLTAWGVATMAEHTEMELPTLQAPKKTHAKGQYCTEALKQYTT